MSVTEKQKDANVNSGVQAILRVLEKKPYYQHRFLAQVQALYGFASSQQIKDVTASLYLTSLFERIPEELRTQIGSLASMSIVNLSDGCPSPAEVRGIVGESVLIAMRTTFAELSERAKLFLSCPPTDENVADRWVERLIYTTVRRIGRERFASISPDDWRREVVETVFGGQMVAYQIPKRALVEPVRRNFRLLVEQHDRRDGDDA